MAGKKIRDRIHKVGVELEGGWEGPPAGLSPEAIIRDGSVSIPMQMLREEQRRTQARQIINQNAASSQLITAATVPPRLMPSILVGEIPSPVLDTSTYADWMRAHYPQHINETCGLHTHTSFYYKIHYMRLMTPEFTSFIVKGLKEWAEAEKLGQDHPIWPRILRKDHRHCAHIYLGDNQVRVARKDFQSRGTPYSRYTAINYCWDYMIQVKGAEVGTIECRLLPMMETADQGIRAVSEVFRLTNLFLSRMRNKEPRIEAKVALAPVIKAQYRS